MDKRVVDITGKKFGKLTALHQVKVQGQYRASWLCKCDCGNYPTVAGSNLRRGSSKSCGCSINQYDFIQLKKNKDISDYNDNVKIRLDQKTLRKNGCLEWQPKYKTNGRLLNTPSLGAGAGHTTNQSTSVRITRIL